MKKTVSNKKANTTFVHPSWNHQQLTGGKKYPICSNCKIYLTQFLKESPKSTIAFFIKSIWSYARWMTLRMLSKKEYTTQGFHFFLTNYFPGHSLQVLVKQSYHLPAGIVLTTTTPVLFMCFWWRRVHCIRLIRWRLHPKLLNLQ